MAAEQHVPGYFQPQAQPREAQRREPRRPRIERDAPGSQAATALFHDRGAMEETVRILEHEGFRRRRIQIYRASVRNGEVRRAPEGAYSMKLGGAIGAGLGALWVVVAMTAAPAGVPFFAAAFRLIAAVAAGALGGALLALIVGAVRQRSDGGYPDFIVEVRTPDPERAREARELMLARGGQVPG